MTLSTIGAFNAYGLQSLVDRKNKIHWCKSYFIYVDRLIISLLSLHQMVTYKLQNKTFICVFFSNSMVSRQIFYSSLDHLCYWKHDNYVN